ncbi:MAG: hypothetical protein GY778_19885, partial [bacterium]|nr:hypothetical protein [bacterium]
VAVSPPGRGRIRYNKRLNVYEQSLNGGPWEVLGGGGNPTFLAQASWFVNRVTGSDSNTGETSAQALASLTEYCSRIGFGRPTVPQTVTLETDLDESDGEITFNGDYSVPNFLTVLGTRTVFGSGSITGAVAYDEVALTRGTITDAGLAVSWTASGFVGKMLVLTAGPQAGATAWIVKDLGAKTAGFSPFDNFFSIVDPTLDTYDIVDLTKINGRVQCNGLGFIFFRDIDFDGDTVGNTFAALEVNSGQVTSLQCRVSGHSSRAEAAAQLVSWEGSLIDTTASTYQVWAGTCLVSGCGLVSSMRTAAAAGVIDIIGDTIVQGDFKAGGANLTATVGGQILVSTDWVGFFDNATANTPAVQCNANSTVELLGKVWGLGWDSASTGIWVDSGGRVLYTDTAPGTLAAVAAIAGAGITEVDLAGIPSTYAQVGALGMRAVQQGTATLLAAGPPASVTVTANITADSRIQVSRNTPAGLLGILSVPTRIA